MKPLEGRIEKGAGWMVYHLHIDGESKPCRIYWRNHGKSYIKRNGEWERVYFNHYVLDSDVYPDIPLAQVDGAWEMVNTYEQLSGVGAAYTIVGNA